jgi:hypothetical protein
LDKRQATFIFIYWFWKKKTHLSKGSSITCMFMIILTVKNGRNRHL